MRKWVLIGCAAVLAGTAGEPPTAPAACAATIKVGGEIFTGIGTRKGMPLRGTVTGVRPACNDVPGSGQNEQDTEVRLRALARVPTALAVPDGDQPRLAYVARGTFPQVRTHPLSRYLRRRDSDPVKCRDRRTLDGRLTATPDGGF